MVSENACSTRLGDRGDGPETLSALQRSRHGFRRSGPHLRSTAIYLRNVIGISYRKIPQAIEELFGITFTPAALIGFETRLAEKAKPVVDDIAKKLGSSDEAVHADETYWTLNGERAYDWVHCDARFAHFQFETSRSGQVSRDVLMAFPVTHEKAVTLQKRIAKHQHEWFVFLDDPRVPPTNNMAERALRPSRHASRSFGEFCRHD